MTESFIPTGEASFLRHEAPDKPHSAPKATALMAAEDALKQQFRDFISHPFQEAQREYLTVRIAGIERDLKDNPHSLEASNTLIERKKMMEDILDGRLPRLALNGAIDRLRALAKANAKRAALLAETFAREDPAGGADRRDDA